MGQLSDGSKMVHMCTPIDLVEFIIQSVVLGRHILGKAKVDISSHLLERISFENPLNSFL